ncbi:hypothetical protein QAD02_019537 [Eretmocerus hayati]|uniref:Uncharacterized protein n=1 Tax=Eretmocerus hayati TaxID=131215 RepID=A0ACC2PPN7_9HYME|nr:hypothetical protein QAD02_019537 [Eretmocerus hayati]
MQAVVENEVGCRNPDQALTYLKAVVARFLIGLLLYGSDPNIIMDDGAGSALRHAAVELNNVQIVVILLNAKADTNFRSASNSLNETILHECVKYQRCKQILQILVDWGANVCAKNNKGESVLFYATLSRNPSNDELDDSIFEILILSKGEAIARNSVSKAEIKTFIKVLEMGSLLIVHLFMKYIIRLEDLRDEPLLLFIAVKNKKYQDILLDYLVNEALFDIEMKNSEGNTILQECIRNSESLRCIEILLSDGANPNCYSKYDDAPLYIAVDRASVKTVKLLIEYGAHLNCETLFSKVFESIFLWYSVRTYYQNNYLIEQILTSVVASTTSEANDVYPKLWERHQSGYKLFSKCKNELKSLKDFITYKSYTLYDLHVGNHTFIKYLSHYQFVTAFREIFVKENYPIYGDQLQIRFTMLSNRNKIMERAIPGLKKVFKFHIETFPHIIEVILSSLKSNDLLNLGRV